MIVQWCIKGMSLPDEQAAHEIIDRRAGLICNWWRSTGKITPPEIRQKLTDDNLDRHVNHFTDIDPATKKSFSEHSPFISLSAGVVERDAATRTNYTRRAKQTALWFGSSFGSKDLAFLFQCWVVLAPRPSVEVEPVAEEVRDLNAYRRYSSYQPEGEIVAKIIVPDNQIYSCETWQRDRSQWIFRRSYVKTNKRFTRPEQLSNIRGLI